MRIPFTKKLTMFVSDLPLSLSTNQFVDFYDETDSPVGFWDGSLAENQLMIYTSGTFNASNLVEVADVFRSLGL